MIYRFGDCELDTNLLELRRRAAVQPVDPPVFELLPCLVERSGEFDAVWRGRAILRRRAVEPSQGGAGGHRRKGREPNF